MMLISYKNVKEYEDKDELTEKQLNSLEEYIERKKQVPCTDGWHKDQLGHAEEVLYKHQRNDQVI